MTNTISIVIGFKNREISRVKNSLDSLTAQRSEIGFELIFVDYGSEDECSNHLLLLLHEYPFVKYIKANTKGWFWNRSHALNIGASTASGDILIFSDIDIIYEPDFTHKIVQLDIRDKFYTLNCYYCNRSQKNYQYHFLENKKINNRISYVGVCILLRENFTDQTCFNTFYQIWGAEDDSFYKNLESKGLSKIEVLIEDIIIFHQWHQSNLMNPINIWYLTMLHHLFDQNNKSINANSFYEHSIRILTSKGKILLEKEKHVEIKLIENKIYYYLPFFESLSKMNSQEVAYFQFKANTIFGFVTKGNRKKISNIMEVIQYFVGLHRSHYLDYFIEHNSTEIFFSFQKK